MGHLEACTAWLSVEQFIETVPKIPHLKRIGPFSMIKVIHRQHFLVTLDPKRVIRREHFL